ncbi:MAG TPA: AMP-binding protein, partial [Blastocatellia bacterium]|nr:AMP-binding protein [Blastocatellia bacterium]
QKIGAVTVILDARLRGKELEGVLKDADIKLLIVNESLRAEAEDALNANRKVPLWVVGRTDECSFEKRYLSPATTITVPNIEPDDDALILYTSGTTGDPKGVVLTYQNLAQYPRVMAETQIMSSSSVRGCILPMSHIVGPIVCNDLADKGFTLVIFDQINPITLLEGIQKYRVTVFESVPIVFQLLLGVRNFGSYDTRSLKVVGMMGTTIPVPLLRAFQSAQPHVNVIQGYGLTETSPLITLVEPEKAELKLGSIGRPVTGVEVRVVDENGNEVPVGEPGEIITRGPHVMKGYFRKPEATAARVRNGWLFTGDIGRCEADGYYYHLGRRDDMIITGGLNVYPAEVETMIYHHASIQEAVVFAIPDAKRGHVIGAAVVPRPGATIVEKDLLTFLRANLANFKVPQKITIRQSLPRTTSGKTIREAAVLLSDSSGAS